MDVTLLEVKLNGGEFTANAPLSFAGGVEQTDSTTADEPAPDTSDGETGEDEDSDGTGTSRRRLLVGLVVFAGVAVLAYYLAGDGPTAGTGIDNS